MRVDVFQKSISPRFRPLGDERKGSLKNVHGCFRIFAALPDFKFRFSYEDSFFSFNPFFFTAYRSSRRSAGHSLSVLVFKPRLIKKRHITKKNNPFFSFFFASSSLFSLPPTLAAHYERLAVYTMPSNDECRTTLSFSPSRPSLSYPWLTFAFCINA
jgi:hypothetical protein